MPCYVYRTKASFLDKKNSKVHKQLVMMKGKRLVWVEELPKEAETNSELMKELADGKQIENEIMFGTSEIINIMYKVFAITNHIPNISAEEQAVYNRFKQVSFNSHFDRTGTRLEEDPENLRFIANTSLCGVIKTEYYNEVFNLIIEYANKYYERKMKMPSIPQQFIKDTKETKETNDAFGKWFAENCEFDEDGRVALKELVSLSGINEKLVKSGMMRLGKKYDKDLSKIGKDAFGKAYKGGFIGIKLIVNEIDER
jgi:phage/plasmid-associated DNA primase